MNVNEVNRFLRSPSSLLPCRIHPHTTSFSILKLSLKHKQPTDTRRHSALSCGAERYSTHRARVADNARQNQPSPRVYAQRSAGRTEQGRRCGRAYSRCTAGCPRACYCGTPSRTRVSRTTVSASSSKFVSRFTSSQLSLKGPHRQLRRSKNACSRARCTKI